VIPGSPAALVAADWIEDEWYSLPVCAWLRDQDKSNTVVEQLPAVFSLHLANGSMVAIGALLEHDMPDRPDWTPWLSCLYVKETARHQGLGGGMVSFLIQNAKTRPLDRLFLFCSPGLADWYTRFGFSVVENRNFEDQPAVTMVLNW
jgi:N-acetylglutamate synthase-like GNAT family acetyltransferase